MLCVIKIVICSIKCSPGDERFNVHYSNPSTSGNSIAECLCLLCYSSRLHWRIYILKRSNDPCSESWLNSAINGNRFSFFFFFCMTCISNLLTLRYVFFTRVIAEKITSRKQIAKNVILPF